VAGDAAAHQRDAIEEIGVIEELACWAGALAQVFGEAADGRSRRLSLATLGCVCGL
jgi:hypothetical protein